MPLELFDTHCHLDLVSKAERPGVLSRARAANVVGCVSIGTSLEASRENVAMARAEGALVRASVGIHPHDAHLVTEQQLRDIDALSADPAVVAIGEVGLDFFRQTGDPDVQRRIFSAFLAMAQRRKRPILIHCRNAYDALLELLRAEATLPLAGLIHCASGPPEFIQGALALGLHISFAGNVTFPNAQALRELINVVPDDRVLIETDAPFLAPQPVRGKKNEPAHLAYTAAYIAQWRGSSLEHLAAVTTRNARRLFGLADKSATIS
ncbi:MAG: TatD family hydrolase [Candidatus Omnitrophica bacterium]|nr:TatD family hydrolase [Candidatus Omnitrophota bacterium]